ncbi:non-ribosomal peptide synthetase [Granulicella mallensis]|uniref:Amino acid adenylation domain-containing protein n=1 Tax=Granulicella mallensis TaxID=940614 RepID=A0A7W7ZN21_9BACT|nr:non-ribosomal peptide synthetase [Granulicella mallensis]MBB5062622.1 amino acid adenylation domain-containing protein [Granulicella mallensis]
MSSVPAISELTAQAKRQLLKDLLRKRLGEEDGWFPLSPSQEALWFLWKLAEEKGTYHIAVPVGIRGPLDVAVFERCWQTLIDRHLGLRLQFAERDGKPMQRSIHNHRFVLRHIDASSWTEEQLANEMRSEYVRRIDLEASASPSVILYKRKPGEAVLLIVLHHIAGDLWSLIVTMDELRILYDAEQNGRRAELPPPAITLQHAIEWQARQLSSSAGDRLRQYWQQELQGDLPLLDLPTDRPRPLQRSFAGSMYLQTMDAELAADLQRLAADNGVTLFSALLAAYLTLLHRFSGQQTVIAGTPVAGRSRKELEPLVGDMVNMVPLRAEFDGNPTFRDLLKQMRSRVTGAIAHGDFPFSLMLPLLEQPMDRNRTPVFQTMFVLQRFQRYPDFSRSMLPTEDISPIPFAGLELIPMLFAQQEGQYDLSLEMKQDEQGRLIGGWRYSTSLFDLETIQRLAAHFVTLLRGVVSDPGLPVASYALMTPDETERFLQDGRGATRELPAEKTVCELFLKQAHLTPNAIALCVGERILTYAELEKEVDRLARRIHGLQLPPGFLMPILLPRGVEFITAILAIHRAGGAFLPMDPRHPMARTAGIVTEGGTPVVLTTAGIRTELQAELRTYPEALRCRLLTLEELPQPEPTLPDVPANGLAYVMFTSGSTGKPKGVMVEHRGMINHVLGKLQDLGITAMDRVAQTGPQSFDIVVWQCVAPLVAGASVWVFTDDEAENPHTLLERSRDNRITVLQLVPSMLTALLDEAESAATSAASLQQLRWMVPTGDAFPTVLAERWLALFPHVPLLNTYGSTECSDDQCHYALDRLEGSDLAVPVVSIGTPIANMTAYVLDGALRPVPVGVAGELYIGGAGVGRGYAGQPELTAQSFLPDPFSTTSGARLYRTRDRVRRRPDGRIDFMGRNDHVIKLQGLRIEPREIEAVMVRHPDVLQAAVLLLHDPWRQPRLTGYYTGTATSESLLRWLAEHLPQSMIPSVLCSLAQLPMNSSGKLDRKQLPEPDWGSTGQMDVIAPQTPAEQALYDIWQAVLGRSDFGTTHDFFAVGGDSIRSIQVVSRARSAQYVFQVSDIFIHRTIGALARVAKTAMPIETHELPAIQAADLATALQQVQFDEED